MNERKPGIQSALGSVSHSSSGSVPRKVLTVTDPSDDEVQVRTFSSGSYNGNDDIPEDIISAEEQAALAQNRERLQSMRKASQQQKSRIPEGLKQRLEILTGIGRLSEDIKVDDVTFSIRSLKPIENEEIIKSIAGIDIQAIQLFELRAQTMARSIYKIDGQDIDFVIDAKSIEDKVNFIKYDLEESLVNFLYGKYQGILTKNKDKFNELGKTEEEVIENVKKS